MLIRVGKDNVEEIHEQAHEREYRLWQRNMAPADMQGVRDALNEHINTHGHGEIVTSSWIPGADWRQTPYQPIYTAVGEDWQSARYFYGLILWNVMMNRPEAWSFGRYPKRPGEVIGLTYFRVHLG